MSIEAIALAIPSLRQTAADIARDTGADEGFISQKVGLQERYILADGETGIGLSAKACRNLMDQNPDLSNSVDLIVCVTQNPDQRIPHNSPGIAEQLGLSSNIASFDISLGCSGFVYAVSIMEGFLKESGLKNGILVTCDPYSRIMAKENKDTNCVFGDAATATWIKAYGLRSTKLATDFGTDGSGGSAIQIEAGGSALPLVCLSGESEVEEFGREQLRLTMQGRAVFNFVMQRVPPSISKCLAKADLILDDIDYFALHQGSTYMLDALARRVGIPPDKVLKNMAQYGNTVSSTIPLLLAELDTDDKLDGTTVLLSGFGVGLSWATSIVRFGSDT